MAKMELTQFAAALTKLGMPAEFARKETERIDPLMKDCILKLYRTAQDVGSEWQPELKRIRAPGLVMWGRHDQGCPDSYADALARDTTARAEPNQVIKFDAGHWFILERAQEAAAALTGFWTTLTHDEEPFHGTVASAIGLVAGSRLVVRNRSMLEWGTKQA